MVSLIEPPATRPHIFAAKSFWCEEGGTRGRGRPRQVGEAVSPREDSQRTSERLPSPKRQMRTRLRLTRQVPSSPAGGPLPQRPTISGSGPRWRTSCTDLALDRRPVLEAAPAAAQQLRGSAARGGEGRGGAAQRPGAGRRGHTRRGEPPTSPRRAPTAELDAAAPAELGRTRGSPGQKHAPGAPTLQPQDGRGERRGALQGAGRRAPLGTWDAGPPAQRRRRGAGWWWGSVASLWGATERSRAWTPDVPEPPARRMRGSDAPGLPAATAHTLQLCQRPRFSRGHLHSPFGLVKEPPPTLARTLFTSELMRQLLFQAAGFST